MNSAYPAYRDSGVAWLGRIPSHWPTTQLKRLVQMRSGEAIVGEEIDEVGEVPVFGGNGLRGFSNRSTHQGDYVLVGRQGALCGNVNYATGRFFASEHAVVCAPRAALVTRWLGELLRAMNLGQYSIAAAQPGLSVDVIERLHVPVPSLEEQNAIAVFLGRETAKIDALVAEQERLIELLKEKRQAVISHAVTKGLNPDAPMKDSGIEWLGQIPAHWSVLPLTRLASRVVVGIAEAATHAYSDSGTPILRSTNIRAGRIEGEILFVSSAFSDGRDTKKIDAGDLVTVRTGNAGVTAVVPEELDGCQCFTMLITTLNTGQLPEFYCYWMNSIAAQSYFSLEGWGTAQVNISVPILKFLPVPVPPLDEQVAIKVFLDSEVARLDELAAEATGVVRLLGERRAALISAAVTGQIDVREAWKGSAA